MKSFDDFVVVVGVVDYLFAVNLLLQLLLVPLVVFHAVVDHYLELLLVHVAEVVVVE